MPLTTAQIEEQMTLEREAISLGFKKLNDQTLKLENQYTEQLVDRTYKDLLIKLSQNITK